MMKELFELAEHVEKDRISQHEKVVAWWFEIFPHFQYKRIITDYESIGK